MLGAIDNLLKERDDLSPPYVGIMPLGTGNDMSRTLGWGSSYEKKKVHAVFAELDRAKPIALDRWKVECNASEVPFEEKKKRRRKSSRDTSKDSDKERKGSKDRESDKERHKDKERGEKETEEGGSEGGESASFVMNNYFRYL